MVKEQVLFILFVDLKKKPEEFCLNLRLLLELTIPLHQNMELELPQEY